MQKIILPILLLTTLLQACTSDNKAKNEPDTVYVGDKGDALIESLSWDILQKIKKGDIVWTKQPELFLDFSYSVAYNDYNSAVGKFIGWDRKVVGYQQETTLFDLMKKAKSNAAAQSN